MRGVAEMASKGYFPAIVLAVVLLGAQMVVCGWDSLFLDFLSLETEKPINGPFALFFILVFLSLCLKVFLGYLFLRGGSEPLEGGLMAMFVIGVGEGLIVLAIFLLKRFFLYF